MRDYLTAASLAAALLAAPAATAATCADRAHVVDRLADRHGETLMATAPAKDGAILEVYGSDATESWTVLVTLPWHGLTCYVGSGSGYATLTAEYGTQARKVAELR